MARQQWGDPDGIAVGSDVALEAVLTVDGAVSPSRVTSSGTYTLSVENSGQPLSPLLSDEASDSVTASSGLIRWEITAAQTVLWPAGTFDGDIKLIDSGGTVTYWPVSVRVRTVVD